MDKHIIMIVGLFTYKTSRGNMWRWRLPSGLLLTCLCPMPDKSTLMAKFITGIKGFAMFRPPKGFRSLNRLGLLSMNHKIMVLFIIGVLLFPSVSWPKEADQRGEIILLNDSAVALGDSNPRMAEALTQFADEKEKALEDKNAGKDDLPLLKEEVIKKQQTDRIKLLRDSAAILQATYPEIAKGLIKMAGPMPEAVQDGFGKEVLSDGSVYNGEFKNGLFNGEGTLTTAGGDRYEGEFREGKFNGHGEMDFADHRQYIGEFKDGLYDGKGVLIYVDSSKYEGQFKEGRLEGTGTLTYADGRQLKGAI